MPAELQQQITIARLPLILPPTDSRPFASLPRRFALSSNRFTYPTLAILLLVALRVAIGWYFFDSARKKHLDRHFSSVGFLSQATGPFASWYKSRLPDNHGFGKLLATPQADAPNLNDPETKADDWQAFDSRSYGAWREQIVSDWGRYKDDVTIHFSFDDAGQQKALAVFNYHEARLKNYFNTAREDIEEIRHELYRQQQWQNSATAEDVPFQADRIALKTSEIRGKGAAIQSAVRSIEADYRRELVGLATTDQLKERGDPPNEPDALAGFDKFLTVTHFAIGACLVIGLFSRLASFGGGLFLLTVIAAQPPWIVGYQTIGYQIIMMVACFLLTATAAGQWAGLDYFVRCLPGGKCCGGNKGTTDAAK